MSGGRSNGAGRSAARRAAAAGILLALLWGAGPARGEESKTNRADLDISGFGLIGNLELKKQLRLMLPDRKLPALLTASQIEDMVLIVFDKVRSEGYLEPTVIVEATETNGVIRPFVWEDALDTFLPLDLVAAELDIHVHHGVRFYYEELEFVGLTAVPEELARAYFVATDALLQLKSMRVYTPQKLDASVGQLENALARRGFVNVTVVPTAIDINPTNGAVRVVITVTEGRPTVVRTVEVQTFSPHQAEPIEQTRVFPNEPLSDYWMETYAHRLRTNLFHRGYPDAEAELEVQARSTNATLIEADVLARVFMGTNIFVGDVRFEGNESTRESVLRRFARFQPGQSLHRIEAERARERLARLGIFNSVVLRYDPVDAYTRDVVYELDEGKFFSSRLLVSYGSYDLLGGGIELLHGNMLGRAHQARLTARQTFKSTIADVRYTMPELLRQRIDVFFMGSFLRREEISFDREEYGGGVGVHRYWPRIRTDGSLRYDYQFLNALSGPFTRTTTLEDTLAAAIVLDLKQDRRDNPLHPQRGYRVFSTLEFASDKFGGEVSYQRLLFGGAKHFRLGGGRFIHVGAIHGLTFTLDGSDEELPFNKRFFPGGDNSVRGFQFGAAAPRNENGDLIGAETYLQGNLEFEQFITRTISVVGFTDVVGFAENRDQYPFDEVLYSVGGGVRLKTVVGPVRLEYGHNLNPRPADPGGTLHFSFGFPF